MKLVRAAVMVAMVGCAGAQQMPAGSEMHGGGAAFLTLTPTTACLAQAVEKQACNVDVDITDTDPKGANVRSTPGGTIIASLKNPNAEGWIGIHITGQFGDWYEIDRANLINADLGPDGKIIFRGKGYLHKSVLGVSGMQNGGAIYRDYDVKSSPIDLHARGIEPAVLAAWLAPYRDHYLVDGELFIAVLARKTNGCTVARSVETLHRHSGLHLHAALGERAHDRLRDLLVDAGKDLRERFQDGDLRTRVDEE